MLGFGLISMVEAQQAPEPLSESQPSSVEACSDRRDCTIKLRVALRDLDQASRRVEVVQETLPTLQHGMGPALGTIVRRGDRGCPWFRAGSFDVCGMSRPEATRYCRDYGGLPTSRQLIQLSNTLGPAAFRETAFPGVPARDNPAVGEEMRQMFAAGYSVVWADDTRPGLAAIVDFYYNISGYQFPGGDVGRHFFFSALASPGGVHVGYNLNDVKAYSDRFWDYFPRHWAVRCARASTEICIDERDCTEKLQVALNLQAQAGQRVHAIRTRLNILIGNSVPALGEIIRNTEGLQPNGPASPETPARGAY